MTHDRTKIDIISVSWKVKFLKNQIETQESRVTIETSRLLNVLFNVFLSEFKNVENWTSIIDLNSFSTLKYG